MNWLVRLFDIHPNLVEEEINTLVLDKDIEWVSKNLALISTSESDIKDVFRRSISIKFILKSPIIIETSTILNDQEIKKLNIEEKSSLTEKVEFVARFHQFNGNIKKSLKMDIEKRIGGWILSSYPHYKVNLTNPNSKFYCVSWGKKSALGWVFGEKKYSEIAYREPKKLPYFRGGTMKPRLCRLLVNLLHPLHASVLDPFCGHGGLLREIADLGSFAVGIEINKKITRELKENNRCLDYDGLIAIIMGDSIRPPFRKKAFFMSITDPPYAIQTTTKGIARDVLFKSWMHEQPIKMKIVFTTPTDMIEQLPTGWIVDFDGYDYVHKSLTRRVRRMMKVG